MAYCKLQLYVHKVHKVPAKRMITLAENNKTENSTINSDLFNLYL